MSVFTLANQLSLLRLLLVPVFAICMIYAMPGWALLTFVVASVTDVFDGLIARRTGPTTLGAWLDPAADKALLLTMFVILTIPSLAPVATLPLWLTVLVISRDLGIVITVAIVNFAVGPRTFKPSWLGKSATVCFALTGVVALWVNYRGVPHWLFDVGVWTSLGLTLASGLEYIAKIRVRER